MAPDAPASAPASPEAPLRASVWVNRGKEARYRPDEWIVLRLAASAPCFAAVYRIGPSGSVTQVLAPAEKAAGSYGFAVRAGECGKGVEWAIAVMSAQPLSAAEIGAVLQSCQDSPSADDAIRAVRAYVQSPRDTEESAPGPEAWQWAVAAVRYLVEE